MESDLLFRDSELPFDLKPFRVAYDRNPQAFCIVYVLTEGERFRDIRFVYANEAYAKLCGFSLKQLIGHTYAELLGQPGEQWNALYGAAAYGGETKSTVLPGPEINAFVNIQCFQIAPGYCGSNVLDLTPEINVAAKAKAESAASMKRVIDERGMYETLLNQSSAMITVIDGQTHQIVYANAAAVEVTKKFADGYISTTCYESIAHRTAPCDNCVLSRAGVTEEIRELPYGERTYRMIYKQIEWNGRPALMEFSEDITEEKQLLHLAEENGRLQENIIANIPTGVIVYRIVNHTYQVVQVNAAICRMLDLHSDTAAGAVGDAILARVIPEDRAIVRNAAIQMAAPGRDVHYEFRSRMPRTEHTVWMGADGRGVLQPNGEVYIYIAYNDITDRKEKEMEFQQKMDFLANLNDEKLISKGRHNLTKNKVLGLSVLTSAAVRAEEDESYDELLPLLVATAVKAADRARIEELFNRENLLAAFAKGQREFSFDYRRSIKDQPPIWATVKGSLFEEPGTHDVIAFLYSYDSTDQVEEARIISRIGTLEYELIGLIDVHTHQYKRVYAAELDPQTYRGKSLDYDALIQQRTMAPNVLDDKEKLHQSMKLDTILTQLESRTIYDVEYSRHGKDGRFQRMRSHFSYLDENRDTVMYFRQDITENYEKEQERVREVEAALAQAKEANEAKSMFYSRMSHDMRTPMNGILGMAQLSEGETDAAILQENLKKIKASGDYLLSLINDTLDAQRIESGKLVLEPQIVYTLDIVENVLDMVRETAKAKGVTLKYSPGNADLDNYIRADALRLKQIFINLMSNAVKFTPKGGTVELTFDLLARDGMISHDRIYVRDTGLGMSKAFLQNGIFKPFSQENNAVSAKYAGSGLGLSIAKSLVELMGGRIEVESEPGVGTTFTVYLDFERVAPAEAELALKNKAKESAGISSALHGKKILLAEDHPLNAEIARKLLQKVGCEVAWVQNGQEAVSAFAGAAPRTYDVILMDIRMPVMDGLQAAKALRALSREDAKNIPIIAMTANAYEDDKKAALAAGMNAHLGKPIVPAVLYGAIADAVQKAPTA